MKRFLSLVLSGVLSFLFVDALIAEVESSSKNQLVGIFIKVNDANNTAEFSAVSNNNYGN